MSACVRRLQVIALMVGSCSLLLLLPPGCSSSKQPASAGGPFSSFRDGSNGPITGRADAQGRVRTIEGAFSTAGATPEERARAFIARYKDNFGLTDTTGDLSLVQVLPADSYGGESVIFGQTMAGLPVFGATVAVHMDKNGVVTFASADLAHEPLVSATPVVAEAAAKSLAEASLAVIPGYAPYPITSGVAELLVLCPGLLADDPGPVHLVWAMTVDGGTVNTRRRVFIDAHSGELRLSIPLSLEALVRETSLITPKNPPEPLTSDTRVVDTSLVIWDEGGQVVESAYATPQARQLHTMAGQVHQYFLDTFGWDSYDGAGTKLRLFVEYVPVPEEARNGELQAFYQHGDGAGDGSFWFTAKAVQLDVLAHEYTHGVVLKKTNLIYAAYPGAIHEALADIFAAFVDEEDRWQIVDRNLQDPGSAEYTYGEANELSRPYPAHWDERHRLDTQACPCPDPARGICLGSRCWDISWDGGATHENGTILSHAVYLAHEKLKQAHQQSGTSGGEIEVLQEVFWRALHYVQPAPTFLGFRDYVRWACRDLVGTLALVGYKDCGALINAFAEVGLGAGDRDNDSFDDDWDNCPEDYNPQQEDKDSDGKGDACSLTEKKDAGPSTPPPSSVRCPKTFLTHSCEGDNNCRAGAYCCPDRSDCVSTGAWEVPFVPPDGTPSTTHEVPELSNLYNYYLLRCSYESPASSCAQKFNFMLTWQYKGVPLTAASSLDHTCSIRGQLLDNELHGSSSKAYVQFPSFTSSTPQAFQDEVLNVARQLLSQAEAEAEPCP